MKITKMIVNSKNKNMIDIFVDNEPFCTTSAEIVLGLNLKKDVELNLETVDALFEKHKTNEAYNKALNLISKNLKTKKQIITYLKDKGFDFNTINSAVERLENAGLIDDRNFAKKFIESQKSKKGNMAIKYALIQKGIDKNIVEEELNNSPFNSDVIMNIANKYLKNKPLDKSTIQKLNRHLLSKGFSYSEVSECIGKLNYEDRD